MTAEETELTFVRCPNCRSLMLAASTRCKMCGTAFEPKQTQEPVAQEENPFADLSPPAPSRIRQKTMSVNAEEVRDIKSRLNAAPVVESPVSESIEKPYRLGGTGIPNRVEQIINRLAQAEPARAMEVDNTGAGFDEVENEEIESEVEARFEAEISVDEDPSLKLGSLLSSLGASKEQEEEVAEAAEQDEGVVEQEEEGDAEGEDFELADRNRFAGEEEEEMLEEADEEEEEEEQLAVSPLPQARRKRRRRRKKKTPAPAAEAPLGERPVAVAEPQSPGVQVQSFAPRSQRSGVQQQLAQPTVERVEAVESSNQQKVEGALLGWFVNFQDDPAGRGTEIRSGRFFIGSQQLRPQDFVVTHASVSTPHCMVNADSSEGLFVQDLMSEKGTFLKQANSNTSQRVSNMVHVGHGDSLKIGEVELLICLLPLRR